MDHSTEIKIIACPYCNESVELVVDRSQGNHDYVEDCSVCCQPIVVDIACQGQMIDVLVRRENE